MYQEHESQVKDFFESPEKYLHKRFGIRIRQELVTDFLSGKKFSTVIDLGCGDGSISLPLLGRTDFLYLLDISANMLVLSKKNVPGGSLHKVKLVHGSYPEIMNISSQFDLVLAIGLLAHISSLDNFFSTVSNKIAPGGYLLIQFTSGNHIFSRINRFFRKHYYTIPDLRIQEIQSLLMQNGFRTERSKRFNLVPPGFGKLPDQWLYRYEKMVLSSFLSSIGTDYFILAQKN